MVLLSHSAHHRSPLSARVRCALRAPSGERRSSLELAAQGPPATRTAIRRGLVAQRPTPTSTLAPAPGFPGMPWGRSPLPHEGFVARQALDVAIVAFDFSVTHDFLQGGLTAFNMCPATAHQGIHALLDGGLANFAGGGALNNMFMDLVRYAEDFEDPDATPEAEFAATLATDGGLGEVAKACFGWINLHGGEAAFKMEGFVIGGLRAMGCTTLIMMRTT